MNFKTTIILKNGCLQKKNNQYSKNNCIQTLLFIKYFFNPSHFSKTFTMVLSFKKKKILNANDSSRQLFHPFLINVSISWVSYWVFSFSIYYRILILGVVLRAMTKSFFSFYLRFKYITRIWIDVFIKHYLQIRFLNLN
jgi:hypothetical protein